MWFAGGDTLAQLQNAVAPATFAPSSYYSLPSTLRNPKYVEWSFEVQRQLGAKNVLSLHSDGNHGYDIFLVNPERERKRGSRALSKRIWQLPVSTRDPRFSGISQLTNRGYANYSGLSALFRHGLASGLQSQISYTWSHALDTLSNGGLLGFSYDSLDGQINPYDLRSLSYSNADYDVRHNITGDFI